MRLTCMHQWRRFLPRTKQIRVLYRTPHSTKRTRKRIAGYARSGCKMHLNALPKQKDGELMGSTAYWRDKHQFTWGVCTREKTNTTGRSVSFKKEYFIKNTSRRDRMRHTWLDSTKKTSTKKTPTKKQMRTWHVFLKWMPYLDLRQNRALHAKYIKL